MIVIVSIIFKKILNSNLFKTFKKEGTALKENAIAYPAMMENLALSKHSLTRLLNVPHNVLMYASRNV